MIRAATALLSLLTLLSGTADAADATAPVPPLLKDARANYTAEAAEVTRQTQADFYLPARGLYAQLRTKRDPEFMWGNGVMFSALVGAVRHDPQRYRPVMARFFKAMDGYWDAKAQVPGYEPAPTQGNGHDKYYDDNAWMTLTFLEAYDLTRDAAYLRRAEQTSTFVLSGWDDQLGGGIWWHEGHNGGGKNTCANAPAAVGCLRLADHLSGERRASLIQTGERLVDWTTRHLQLENGLFADNIKVDTKKIDTKAWTYNSALMIRAYLGVYRHTGDADALRRAQRVADAAVAFVDPQTHAYHDGFKFTHLLVEADLELFRTNGDDALLRRAISNADHAYAVWKAKPPADLIENASIARMLWLMADMQSESGLKFWRDNEPSHPR